MKLSLHSGHMFVVSGDLKIFNCPGMVFLLISCCGISIPRYTSSINSDPTTECGSCLELSFLKGVLNYGISGNFLLSISGPVGRVFLSPFHG